MTAIAFRFLAGRYHATPWDRAANEGAVEWPPSPWRVLRALVAASYRLDPRPDREELDALIGQLASPPIYHVPAGAVAHTRHYMPTDAKPTLIFDTFVAVGGGASDDSAELIVAWPGATLDERSSALLDRLLTQLAYLGRSESWIEARRTNWNGEANVLLAKDASPARDRFRVQGLLPHDTYAKWKATLPKEKKNASPLPDTLLEVLEQDSATLQNQGWSNAPGTQYLTYARPDELLRVRPVRKRASEPDLNPVFARYAIRSAVLPLLTDTVMVGERLRDALIKRTNNRSDDAIRIMSGHESDGTPLTGNRHAYFLPVDDDGDGRVDHFVVWARSGFDGGAREALTELPGLWGGRDGHDIYLTLVGLGKPKEYGGSRGGSSIVGPSRVWESRTPFILPRHPKFRRGSWIDTPEDQLRRLLAEFELTPSRIEPLDGARLNGRMVPWYRFRRDRRKGNGSRASSKGYGFRLHFDEPVMGPIAVGYGAHVGLGQFCAV